MTWVLEDAVGSIIHDYDGGRGGDDDDDDDDDDGSCESC